MAGTRGMNTMSEGLQKIMQDLTSLKATPDADVAFLIGLETTILGKLREGFDQAAGQMPAPPGNAMEMGGGLGGLGGLGAGMEAAGADLMGAGAGALAGVGAGGPPAGLPGAGGPMPTSPGPRFNPDVMRRAMRGGGVQGG